MPKAARVGDKHICPAPTPLPHVGLTVIPVCSQNVETNSRQQARSGDRLQCIPMINFIVTGSGTVQINGRLAARENDRTMHPPPGVIMAGSPNVLIGGPTTGATLGNRERGIEACKAARAGRNPPSGATSPNGNQLQPHTAGQSYNNCGVESARQIINQVNPDSPVSQEGLLQEAFQHHDATEVANNLYQSGGTTPQGRVNILERNNVPSHTETGSMDNLAQSVAEGRGVIAAVMAGTMWPVSAPQAKGPPPGEGPHAILVTGVEFDEQGNIKNVIINDTGTGQCGVSVPAATFEQALSERGASHVVTDDPIW